MMSQLSGAYVLSVLFLMVCSIRQSTCKPFDENPKSWPPPPPYSDTAKMARYLVNSANWAIISTVSQEFGVIPFGTLESFTDGPLRNGSGVPYFYLADLSTTHKNLMYNNSASVTISQAESDYCQNMKWDAMLPLCARITLSGKIVQCVGEEANVGRQYLYARHPSMKSWPSGHGWNINKLVITHIFLQDTFGPADILSVKDYFSVNL